MHNPLSFEVLAHNTLSVNSVNCKSLSLKIAFSSHLGTFVLKLFLRVQRWWVLSYTLDIRLFVNSNVKLNKTTLL